MGAYRTINIEGLFWLYKIGRTTIDIRGPNGQKFTPTCAEVKGLDLHFFERGRHKGTSDGMIGPGDIRKFIEEKKAA